MSYALFAQRKVLLTGEINNLSLQQTQRSNEQLELATDTTTKQQQITEMQASQSKQLGDSYEKLAEAEDEQGRAAANKEINELQASFDRELDDINRDIYQTSIKENAIEMEVKILDTELTSVTKQLESVEQAEAAGIDRANPKFSANG